MLNSIDSKGKEQGTLTRSFKNRNVYYYFFSCCDSAFLILFQTEVSCPTLFVLSLIEPLRAQGIIPKLPLLSLIVTSGPGRAPGLELCIWIFEGRKETDVI